MTDKSAAIVEISQTANKFQASIVLQYENKFIDVKSILGLFTTLVDNAEFVLHIHGEDGPAAGRAVAAVFEKHGLKVTFA
jgi:phosphocarrier protein